MRGQFVRFISLSIDRSSQAHPVCLGELEERNTTRRNAMKKDFFGWGWYAKLSAVCFVTGAGMELFMIKTGFCKFLCSCYLLGCEHPWRTCGLSITLSSPVSLFQMKRL